MDLEMPWRQSTTDSARWGYRALSALAMLCALALLVSWGAGLYQWIPSLLSTTFLSLVVAAEGYPTLRKWSFTLWIATAVAVGMSYPQWFIGVGDFKFVKLFVPILQLIMFCMGTTLSMNDFIRVFRMPVDVLIGLSCQIAVMPFLGYAIAIGFGFPPEIGAGIILVGSVSGGLASNVMAYIAEANLALSVTLTAISTLTAPIVTPLMMKTLAGEMIEIDALAMMWDLTKMVLIPVIAGLVFHRTLGQLDVWNRVMPVISMIGIIIMTLLTIAIGRDNLLLLGFLLIPACFLHSTVGYLLAYFVCRLLRREENSCRTIAFEVGMQNSGMAAGLAAELNKVATLGLAPIVFGPVMNITASILANWWRTRPAPTATQESVTR